MKKVTIACLTSLFASSVFAASVTETADYKEYFADAEGAAAFVIKVSTEVYEAARPQTRITFNKVNEYLYVIDQDNIYYTKEAINPPLPITSRQDTASQLIDDTGFVRLLVPAHLSVEVEDFEPGMTCLAYWTGFELNSETGACEQKGASGCSNPFAFQTLQACEAGNGLR